MRYRASPSPARLLLALPFFALAGIGASCALTFPDYGVGGGSTSTSPATTASTAGATEPNGAPCISDGECLDGHCLPKNAGDSNVCCAIACADMGVESCATNGKCDAGGESCSLYPTGAICSSAPSCDDGELTDDRCQGGSCIQGEPTPCAGGLGCADTTTCKETCQSSADCANPDADCPSPPSSFCKQPGGEACASNQECTSGVCGTAGTGHCCDVACSHVGDECGPTDCGPDGKCVFADTETACASGASCMDANLDSNYCDGSGQCSYERTLPCPSHLRCLDLTSCHSSCGSNDASGDALCAPGYWCNGSECQLEGWDEDTPCLRPGQCRSNDCSPEGKCVSADCDFDGDGVLRKDAHCGGLDCDDSDKRAFPGQTAFYTTPRLMGGFDFDCNDLDTGQFTTTCAACPAIAALVPAGADGCGVTGQVWSCYNLFGFCGNSAFITTGKQPCH